MKQMYGALLPFVNHRADLNYLLDNMGAELAVGHSYVRGGDMPSTPNAPGGLLGADFTVEHDRYRIARIYDTESWNPDLRAPLATPGVDVSVGDYILAINGAPLVAPDNIYRLLDGTANRQTVLTVNSRPSMEGARQVTVVPVGNEQGLRTRAWVEHNRRRVDELSGGGSPTSTSRTPARAATPASTATTSPSRTRQGAIIDERFNGGGSAADYIIEVLRATTTATSTTAGDRVPFTSPSAGIWGPEGHDHQRDGRLGRRPAALHVPPPRHRAARRHDDLGRAGRHMGHAAARRRRSMIAPRGGFFARGGVGGRERGRRARHPGRDDWPKDVIAGRDPQLERAVQEALTDCCCAPEYLPSYNCAFFTSPMQQSSTWPRPAGSLHATGVTL
jgi:tricorn protease